MSQQELQTEPEQVNLTVYKEQDSTNKVKKSIPDKEAPNVDRNQISQEKPITFFTSLGVSYIHLDCIPHIMYSMKPIGYVSSVFTYKNGTPRQPALCPYARGTMTIEKSIFTNPEHSLEDLEEFSHVWLIFVFHKNNNTFTKAKVKPPRLNGKRVGVFSTRSPYRPNPIGLTLAKLDSVEGLTLAKLDSVEGKTSYKTNPIGLTLAKLDSVQGKTTYKTNPIDFTLVKLDSVEGKTSYKTNPIGLTLAKLDSIEGKTSYKTNPVRHTLAKLDSLKGKTLYKTNLIGLTLAKLDSVEGVTLAKLDSVEGKTSYKTNLIGLTLAKLDSVECKTSYKTNPIDLTLTKLDSVEGLTLAKQDSVEDKTSYKTNPIGLTLAKLDSVEGKTSFKTNPIGLTLAKLDSVEGKTSYKTNPIGLTLAKLDSVEGKTSYKTNPIGLTLAKLDSVEGKTSYKTIPIGLTLAKLDSVEGKTSYRTNPMGLTLAKLDSVEGKTSYKTNPIGLTLAKLDSVEGKTSYRTNPIGLTLTKLDSVEGKSSYKTNPIGLTLAQIDSVEGKTSYKTNPIGLTLAKLDSVEGKTSYKTNPIGLTLAKIDRVKGSMLHLSGIDLLDGTPVLDIKPYIPSYDIPQNVQNDPESCLNTERTSGKALEDKPKEVLRLKIFPLDQEQNNSDNSVCQEKSDEQVDCKQTDNVCNQADTCEQSTLHVGASEFPLDLGLNSELKTNDDTQVNQLSSPVDCENVTNNKEGDIFTEAFNTDSTKTADWIETPPIDKISVRFTNLAQEQLKLFSSSAASDFCLKYLKSGIEVSKAISDILCQDPRSVYRRKHCVDSLYYFVVDIVHVTAWFDKQVAEVVRIQPVSHAEHYQNS
ncbi:TRMO [Mytilus coruscus]|uniref:TRMO n=1 Tax=Mytilus coruscus TaxID=42192 RepID=A0A6J8CGC6_MYTCO|nr:TRMO [Mytilus coruscus]